MRYAFISPILLAALSAGALGAQAPDTATTPSSNAATDQALIANALSAAPEAVEPAQDGGAAEPVSAAPAEAGTPPPAQSPERQP